MERELVCVCVLGEANVFCGGEMMRVGARYALLNRYCVLSVLVLTRRPCAF